MELVDINRDRETKLRHHLQAVQNALIEYSDIDVVNLTVIVESARDGDFHVCSNNEDPTRTIGVLEMTKVMLMSGHEEEI